MIYPESKIKRPGIPILYFLKQTQRTLTFRKIARPLRIAKKQQSCTRNAQSDERNWDERRVCKDGKEKKER